jgi:septum formation protein
MTTSPPCLDGVIYLASQSPRRRKLLDQIGVQYTLLLAQPGELDYTVTEDVEDNEIPAMYVARVTHEKLRLAQVLLTRRGWPLRPILAADTTVTTNGLILGKPANRIEAEAMLRQLSGNTHQVLTSIAVASGEQTFSATQCSEVTFKQLSDDEISHYCDAGEPYDKAGGYGIQGRAATFISMIRGSHSGVMGLPLFETAELLRQAGVSVV